MEKKLALKARGSKEKEFVRITTVGEMEAALKGRSKIYDCHSQQIEKELLLNGKIFFRESEARDTARERYLEAVITLGIYYFK